MPDNIETILRRTTHPDYDSLPEAIKSQYSPEQYAWLGDQQRRTLQTDMTMPEWEED